MQRNLFKSILIFGILVLFFGTIAAIIYVGLTSDKSFTTSIQQDEYTLIGTTGSSMRNEDWWDYNWSYRKKITFNHTLISNNLSNFPALIYLDSDAEVASHAQVDGDDIVFVDWKDNVTKLNHEIEYYENGTLYAWVNVTRLCCSTDTNIWMYYGNPICSCQENVADTWDSHYTMVQHMTDLTALTTKDSTYRNFNGTKKGVNMPEEVNGKIFKGQDFSAANTEYIEIPTSYGEPNGIPLAPDYDVPWTIEAWIKRKTTGSDQAIMSKMYSYGTCTGWMLDIEDNDKINLWLVYRKNIPFFKWNQIETTETYTAVDRWYYVVGTCNGNTRTSGMNIFVNGNIVGKTTVSDTLDRNPPGGPEHTMADATANIGARRSDGIDNCHFDGIIDEVRFTYNAVRNASWINTSYMNQNDPESFITVDVEESKPIPTAVYVDDDYNNSTPGWQHDHFNKIQDGIDAVAENGTVYVFNGTYYENVVVNKTINLIGEDKNTTFIDAGGVGTVVKILADFVNVSDFTIIHGGGYSSHDSGIEIYSLNSLVKNNIIINHGRDGILIHGGGGNSTIINNFISNCQVDGLWINSPNNLIEGNTVKSCLYGICIRSSHNVVKSNDITNGYIVQGITLSGVYSSCNNNKILDNRMYGYAAGLRLEGACNNTIQNNSIKKICIVSNSNNNIIFHNNFLSAYRYDTCNNSWDNGYPSGGNYWIDYTGEDVNGDGIGDIPHNITGGNNHDRYPLMHLVTCPPVFVWVDDDYNSSTPFWGFDHFNKIQDGINAVAEGGTVYVFNGTYYENVVVNKTITLIGENRNGTIIDSNGIGKVVCISSDHVNLSGFTIQNSGIYGPDAGIWINSNYNNISLLKN